MNLFYLIDGVILSSNTSYNFGVIWDIWIILPLNRILQIKSHSFHTKRPKLYTFVFIFITALLPTEQALRSLINIHWRCQICSHNKTPAHNLQPQSHTMPSQFSFQFQWPTIEYTLHSLLSLWHLNWISFYFWNVTLLFLWVCYLFSILLDVLLHLITFYLPRRMYYSCVTNKVVMQRTIWE